MKYIMDGSGSYRVYRPTKLEISIDKIKKNYRHVKSMVGTKCEVISVVKANAYSMGAKRIAAALEKEGCKRFAVATVEEALELRDASIKGEILVMTTIPDRAIPILIKEDISVSCGSTNLAKTLSTEANRQGKRAKLHIKVDTGLGRTGFLPDQAVESISSINTMNSLEITGIYTHFAMADESQKEYTNFQFSRFKDCLDELERRGINIPLKHACNSPAIINFPEMRLNAVRPGKLLYGLPWSFEEQTATETVCSLKTRIAAIREVPAGSGIGYGLKFITESSRKIGILPIGFFDGFSRMYKSPHVLAGGKKIPVVGNICMDQTMIDLSEIPDAQVGDEVVLMGNQGEEKITINELRKDLDTISTQVLSMISSRVPRIYTQ